MLAGWAGREQRWTKSTSCTLKWGGPAQIGQNSRWQKRNESQTPFIWSRPCGNTGLTTGHLSKFYSLRMREKNCPSWRCGQRSEAPGLKHQGLNKRQEGRTVTHSQSPPQSNTCCSWHQALRPLKARWPVTMTKPSSPSGRKEEEKAALILQLHFWIISNLISEHVYFKLPAWKLNRKKFTP